MKLSKCINRDKELEKRRKGHREDGRSVKLIKDIQKKRALRIRMEQSHKQSILEGE
jgi:hypothetical protein